MLYHSLPVCPLAEYELAVYRDFMKNYGALTQILSQIDFYYNIYPVIGLEIEFYLFPKNNFFTWNISIEKNKILQEFSAALFKKFPGFITQFKCERAKAQYEICTYPRADIYNLLSDYYELIAELKQLAEYFGLNLLTSPKPYSNNYGNSLQINLSFRNASSGEEIFTFNSHKSSSSLLMRAINAILSSLKKNCLIYANLPESYLRMKPGFKAPTHISYGFDNRTTSLRVANSLENNKYLEFRVADISVDLEMGLFNLLKTIYDGWNNPSKDKYNPIYGVASHSQYNLPPLPGSLSEAVDNFRLKQASEVDPNK